MKKIIGHISRVVLLSLVFLGVNSDLNAQEFNCTVLVNTQTLQDSEFSHLQDLKTLVEEYYNRRSWTDDSYREWEKIKCSIEISFLDGSREGADTFRAQFVLNTYRPIFGTSNETSLLAIKDAQWQFIYEPNQTFIQDLNTFNPLTSVLDFYGYLMLGYDYDSFSVLGGSQYFEIARRISDLAQTAGGFGWNTLDEKGRAVLIDQLLDTNNEKIRRAYYDYFYGCLDHYLADIVSARQSGIAALTAFQEVYVDVTGQYVMDVFFDTKNEELVSVFENSNLKGEAYGILIEIDAANASIYDKLIQ